MTNKKQFCFEHDTLSKAELKLISELLEMASDEYSNHGCNDYVIPATDENKKSL